jgi:hypothetical protein
MVIAVEKVPPAVAAIPPTIPMTASHATMTAQARLVTKTPRRYRSWDIDDLRDYCTSE